MTKNRVSAGLLMYRIQDGELQVLLAHPGGPMFKNKDEGFWTIPKGEIESGEGMLETAKREFEEETGVTPNWKDPGTQHFVRDPVGYGN